MNSIYTLNLDPTVFTLFGFSLKWYSLAYIFGFIFAFFFVKYLLRRLPNHSLGHKAVDDLFSYMVLGVLLGGRLGYVLFYNFSHYLANPIEILYLWRGGMSFHGAVIGVICAALYFAKVFKSSFWLVVDLVVLCAPVGLFLGRLANFVNGELYGRPTDGTWGVVFPASPDLLPRHPSQLYEAGLEGVALFAIMLILFSIPRLRLKRGVFAGFFILFYGLFRMLCEVFREPDVQIGFLFERVTMGQILSLPMILFGIFIIFWRGKKTIAGPIYFTALNLNDYVGKLKHAFFSRLGGVSTGGNATLNVSLDTKDDDKNVVKNRQLVAQSLGVSLDEMLVSRQEHTNICINITKEVLKNWNNKTSPIADSLATKEAGIALAMKTADCCPLAFYEPAAGIAAIVHSGWRGSLIGVIDATVKEIIKAGGKIENIIVAVGPFFQGKEYVVQADFYQEFTKVDAGFTRFFSTRKNGYTFLFRKFIEYKLKTLKIKNYEISPFDTYKEENFFFSHRRGMVKKDDTSGRQMDAVKLIK